MSFLRACLLALIACLAAAQADDVRDADYAQGYYGEMLPGLSAKQAKQAESGFLLFVRTWPQGQGERRNADSCVACHNVPMPGGSGMSRQALVAIDARRDPGSVAEVIQDGLSGVPDNPHGEVRRTPPLFGIGYLEAAIGGQGLGAFGKVHDLRTFVAHAFAVELGVSNSVQCARSIGEDNYPRRCDRVLSDEQLDDVVAYLRVLAPPPRRLRPDTADADAAKGEALFRAIGCAACHNATGITQENAIAPLGGRRFEAFTDLRLHDMGTRAMVVTAPLWGLNSMGPPYMHDACGQSIVEAIGCHGGEARRAAVEFAGLSAREKDELVAFLRSL